MTQRGERQIDREQVLAMLAEEIENAEAQEAVGWNPGAGSDLLRDARESIERNAVCDTHRIDEKWVCEITGCILHGTEVDGKSIAQWIRDIAEATGRLRPITCERCEHCEAMESGFHCTSWDMDFYRPDYDPAAYYCADAKQRGGDEP